MTPETILEEAEREIQAKSMAEDRACCGEWSYPKTPADYLMWLEDEAELQQNLMFADETLDSPEVKAREDYASRLLFYSRLLREFGVKPSTPPWAS